MRKLIALLLGISLLGACTSDATTNTTSPETGDTSTTIPPDTSPEIIEVLSGRMPLGIAGFAPFEMIPLLDESNAFSGPPSPTSMGTVRYSPYVESLLSSNPEIGSRLLEQGFVVVPTWTALFQNAYSPSDYDNHAVFVTSDTAYHFLHLAFSKILRNTEEDVLLPRLDHLALGALENAREFSATAAGTDYSDAASRAAQYWEAVASVLGHDVSPLGELAQEEVALAMAATDMTTSPVVGVRECNPAVSAAFCVDYTQYRPRGHYTRNSELERYFRGMSMLGQLGFHISEPDALLIGLFAGNAVLSDPELASDWEEIYEATGFMVGLADDYTPLEAQDAADVAVPGNLTNPSLLSPDDTVIQIGDALSDSRRVGVNPEDASVRLMGARFVIDSYLLDQMGWPNVGELGKQRVMVSPLDVAAAIGSDLALEIQREADEPIYLNYERQMAALRELISTRSSAEWSGTVYDAWMYALAAKWSKKGVAYPEFMRSEAWEAKDLMTGLGSYTELKHDTLLYAKQAFFAEGGGDWYELEPRHWVEPDPVAFKRISQVATLLRDGLDARGLLTQEDEELLNRLTEILDRLGRIAEEELAGEPISDSDNTWLGSISSDLEALWIIATESDPMNAGAFFDDVDDALIADIARSTSSFLEIGTGRVDRILVLVPDDQGQWQIAEGGVFSYYEFWRPQEDGRLTDEEWRAILDEGQAPDRFEPLVINHPEGVTRTRPAWQSVFLVDIG